LRSNDGTQFLTAFLPESSFNAVQPVRVKGIFNSDQGDKRIFICWLSGVEESLR
jgi:hypothetical protein